MYSIELTLKLVCPSMFGEDSSWCRVERVEEQLDRAEPKLDCRQLRGSVCVCIHTVKRESMSKVCACVRVCVGGRVT